MVSALETPISARRAGQVAAASLHLLMASCQDRGTPEGGGSMRNTVRMDTRRTIFRASRQSLRPTATPRRHGGMPMPRALSRLAAGSAMALLLAACVASYPGKIDSIRANDSLNSLTAESAPQQTVVAGWTIRDYSELIATQNIEQSLQLYAVIALLAIIALLQLRQMVQLRRLLATTGRLEPSAQRAPLSTRETGATDSAGAEPGWEPLNG